MLTRFRSLPAVKVAMAVQKRFGRDQAGHLAAAVTYYGFFSLFPLVLLAGSVLGFALAFDSTLAAEIQGRVAGAVPGLGKLASENLTAAERHRAATGLIALGGLLWAGTAAAQASSAALSRIFGIDAKESPVKTKARALLSTLGLGSLAMLGVAVAAVTAVAPDHGLARLAVQAGVGLAVFAADLALFLFAYRALAPGRGPQFARSWPGALLAAAGWTLLKFTGGWYGSRTVGRSTAVYGAFATTIGLLVILSLAARFFLYGAELNAVLGERAFAESKSQGVSRWHRLGKQADHDKQSEGPRKSHSLTV